MAENSVAAGLGGIVCFCVRVKALAKAPAYD